MPRCSGSSVSCAPRTLLKPYSRTASCPTHCDLSLQNPTGSFPRLSRLPIRQVRHSAHTNQRSLGLGGDFFATYVFETVESVRLFDSSSCMLLVSAGCLKTVWNSERRRHCGTALPRRGAQRGITTNHHVLVAWLALFPPHYP